jgi:Aspartyl protease
MTRLAHRLVAPVLILALAPCAEPLLNAAGSEFLFRPLASALSAQERPNPTPPRRVTGIPATVPLLMLGREPAALPVVEVFLDGKGPFRFGIETGANFLVIRPALADSLKLVRTGNNDQYPSFTVNTLSIGAARFEGVRFEALPTSARDIDGVLGLPLYRNVLLTVDYPAKTLRFAAGSLPAANGKDILPLTRTADFWSLPVSIGGRTYQGVIDTRSTGAIGVIPSRSKELAFDGEPIVVGMARGAAIAETEVKMGRLKGDVTIGQYTFPTPEIGIRALPPGFPEEPLIGTVILQHFAMTLDQQNARVQLARSGNHTITLPRRASATGGGEAAPSSSPTGTGQPAATTSAAAQLVGLYGDRNITFEHDTLFIQRPNGQKLALIPTAKDAFTLREVPTAKLEFERDAAGRGLRLRVLNREGQWETVERKP